MFETTSALEEPTTSGTCSSSPAVPSSEGLWVELSLVGEDVYLHRKGPTE